MQSLSNSISTQEPLNWDCMYLLIVIDSREPYIIINSLIPLNPR